MSAQVVLFACSKCFTRHEFHELSPGQQLCKVICGNKRMRHQIQNNSVKIVISLSLEASGWFLKEVS